MFWILLPIVLILLGLFLIAPSPSRRANAWRGVCFAHRGLHGSGAAENSVEAFERACRQGFGIELDVQLSKDGEVIVFHDDTLARMTADPRRVDQVAWSELKTLSLQGGTDRIPSFGDVLSRIDGRVPLLIEIKNGSHNRMLCEKVLHLLRGYTGFYLVESFNPLILRWLRIHAPQIIRGQLVGAKPSYIAARMGPVGAFFLSTLSLNFLARPDFVAYDVSATHFSAPHVQRALFHTPLASWTVRDSETFDACLERGEMPIFEGFLPRNTPSSAPKSSI